MQEFTFESIYTEVLGILDRFNAAIIGALQNNSRITWTRLAEKVNLSTSACQRRVEALREQGVIERFTINLDESALGLKVRAFVAVSIDRQNPYLATEFRDWVMNHRQVKTCHMISGASDYMLEVVAPDLESFGHFLDSELLPMPGVKDAVSSIVLGKVKSWLSATDDTSGLVLRDVVRRDSDFA